MMASGHHSLEPRGPPSPGNASGSSNVAKFSLLGQQFTHYNSSQHHQSPSSSHSSTLAFSVGAHLQQGAHPPQQPSSSQSHPQAHTQQQSPLSHPQSQPGGNRVPTTSGYDNLHHAFPFSGGQGYGAGYGSQGLQDGNVGGLMKMSPPDGPAFSTTSAQALLNALSALQQKIQQLQAVVQMMVQGGGQSAAQQQSVATGVASAISQLVMATAAILQQPSVPAAQSIAADLQLNHLFDGAAVSGLHHFQQNGIANIFGSFQGSTHGNTFANFGNSAGGVASFSGGVGGSGSLGGGIGGSGLGGSGMGVQSLGGQGLGSPSGNYRSSLPSSAVNSLGNSFDMGGGTNADLNSGAGVGGSVGNLMVHGSGALQGSMDDQDPGAAMKDEDDDGEGENLPPGSYELVEMEAIEILAEHTHFCEICGKGFKRDANLRMHMRGHGDEYKTPAALARPDRPSLDPSAVRPRRYSCPYEGCKRNKKHRKFQPLKTMLCVKNHYRRSHCPKIFTCNKCKTKKFSVVADLKTHEKHCGRDKWQCSCGTTFSRKDKLLGHIGLFAGHTPAWPLQEMEGTGGALEAGMSGSGGFNSGSGAGKGNESVFLGAAGSNNFGHGNSSAMVAALGGGNGSVMDVGKGANVGVGVVGSIGRSGLQNLGPRACSLSLSDESTGQSLGDGSSSSALAGSLVPGSSMLHGLLSSSFLQQTNANNETSDVLQ